VVAAELSEDFDVVDSAQLGACGEVVDEVLTLIRDVAVDVRNIRADWFPRTTRRGAWSSSGRILA